MSKGSFRRALLEIDRELARLPYAGERDVRTLLARRRRVPWRLPALAIAAALVLVLIMRARDREPAHVAGFTIDAPASSWQTRGNALEVLAPRLDLDVPGFGHVVAGRGARVARIDGGIEVAHGRVDVEVTHRPDGVAPALVRVSHGTIAVLGTRFTIDQAEHGGRVVLHEGRIRFDAGAQSVVLAAGASLTWPLASDPRTAAPASSAPPPAPAPPPDLDGPATAPSPSKPARVDAEPVVEPAGEPMAEETPQPPTSPALDVERVLDELANLRARRRFAEAAALLEGTLATDLPTTTLERLSYELGDIRTHQLADAERACRHWQSHRARFPQGRYTDEIAAAVRRLGCEETTP